MKLIKATIMIMTITLSLGIYISGTATAREREAAVTDPLTQKMGDPQRAVEQEGPSLPIPAAAQRAENLAGAAANKARAEILKIQQSVAKAEAALNEAKNSGNQTIIVEARARYDAALRSLDGAIANSTGITIDEISAMRSSGMGWVQIASELGVNHGILGLDPPNVKKVDEMEMATARNIETEQSMWHGTRFSGKGMGLDRAESKKEVGSGTDDKGNAIGSDTIASISAVIGR